MILHIWFNLNEYDIIFIKFEKSKFTFEKYVCCFNYLKHILIFLNKKRSWVFKKYHLYLAI